MAEEPRARAVVDRERDGERIESRPERASVSDALDLASRREREGGLRGECRGEKKRQRCERKNWCHARKLTRGPRPRYLTIG